MFIDELFSFSPNKKYAGIGSRRTPKLMCSFFTKLAHHLESKYDLILRSGGAGGADQAFEEGVFKKEIFLPWKSFRNNPSELHTPTTKSSKIAAQHCPYFSKIKQSSRKLFSRNVHIILGETCDEPVDFVLCYAPPDSNGTNFALQIAKSYDIKIFNFHEKPKETYLTLLKYLQQFYSGEQKWNIE